MNLTENTLLAKGMASLVSTVQELSLARDLETIMEIVRTKARELTGADGATFVLRDDGKCFYADEDAISPLWKGLRFPLESCISGWAMINKQSVLIEDIYQDERIPHAAYKPTFVKSLVMVPIRTIDPIGAIGNYWANQHMPTEDEVMLLQSLADITAVAMENVMVYQELEDRVKDRTKQLEAVNKQLEVFSYSVSHDLRSPLTSVTGLLNLLKDINQDQLDSDSNEIIGMIEKSIGQMDNLIHDLLAFFKTDKKELEKATVDMKAMTVEISNELKVHHSGKNITVSIAELTEIKADESLIRQVWVNLISNALKYSGNKELIKVEIGFEKQDDSVTYFVKDNGAGFDMNNYEKLFGAFQRLHNSSEFEGTGIGLSIVERIISRHDGKIWAEGVVGEGATFYFTLPIS